MKKFVKPLQSDLRIEAVIVGQFVCDEWRRILNESVVFLIFDLWVNISKFGNQIKAKDNL